jgi:hypothetical protein
MWREGGKGEIYAYIPPQLQSKALCDQNGNVCNSSYGYSLGRGSWTFKTNAWNSVRQVVKLNTVGKQDGQLTVFINGKQVYQQSNLVYRTKATEKTFGIGKWSNGNDTQLTFFFWSPLTDFQTFFGGSSSEYETPKTQHSFFKGFLLNAH